MDRFDDMKDRSGDILIDLIKRNHLTNEKMGEIMGCGRNTINNYRRKKVLPKPEFLTRLALLFGVNMEWMYHGRGMRYHGDGLGPMKQPYSAWIEARGPATARADAAPADFRLVEAMEKTTRILRSNSPYSFGFALLVDHLDRGHRAAMKKATMDEEKKRLQETKDALSQEIFDMTKFDHGM